jgi:lipoprotein-anchoring transpeptidase ErfK/SrfK
LVLFAVVVLGTPARADDAADPPRADPSAVEPAATTRHVRPEDTPAIDDSAPAAADTAATETPPATSEAAPAGPPVQDWLEAQVELSRRGFSCGSIDGVRGPQTAAALKAFQENEGLRETGELDPATKRSLLLTAPLYQQYTFTAEDLAKIHPVPDTWLGKSQQTLLYYANALELAAEQCHASPAFLRRLNPGVDWTALLPGVVIKVPAVGTFTTTANVARLDLRLSEHVLEALDESGHIVLHFPVSIARNVEKRPVGELHVTVAIHDPVYTWDPELFPESPESRTLGHKLILPPGPNNPVGLAWIGLDRTGYGIHGTPEPENVGRTESHGCFRLANWDALALIDLVWVGMPVDIEP